MGDPSDELASVRAMYAAVDWASTPLGPPEDWSPTLRGAAELAVHTRFPVTLMWGPELVLVYNEAYVALIGDKHPAALGLPAREVFPEIWDTIGPMLTGVMDGHGATWVQDERLVLNRHGFDEECYFTFSYSPVAAPDGTVEGVIDIAAETTAQVVTARRLALVARLGQALTADFDTPDDLVAAALTVLRSAGLDLVAVDIDLSDGSGPVDEEPLDEPAVDRRAEIRVPLRSDGTGGLNAVLTAMLSAELPMDDGYRDFVRLIAQPVSQAMERMRSRVVERRAADAERGIAEAMQRTLLSAPVQQDNVEVAVRYQPTAAQAQVGGDWYDAFLLPDGTLAVTVGDVSGHDRASAAAMSQVRNLLRGVSWTDGRTPPQVLTVLDQAMAGLGVDVLATAVVAHVAQPDAEAANGTRTLRWSNAGHLPPVLVSAEGKARLLETGAELLLGMHAGAHRTEHSVVLESGTTVVFYTDGLIERRRESLQDSLDELVAHLSSLPAQTAEQLCDNLLDTYGSSTEDDVVLLVLRVRPDGHLG